MLILWLWASLERLKWFQVTYAVCPVGTDHLGARDFAGADSDFPVHRCVFMNVTKILCNFIPTICYIAYPKLAWELFKVQNVSSEKCIFYISHSRTSVVWYLVQSFLLVILYLK